MTETDAKEVVKQTGYVHIQECFIGLRMGMGHTSWIIKREIGKLISLLEWKDHDSVGKRNQSASNELQVIGVGFGRTGTYSLKMALDKLGYPTLHTQHLYEIGEILDMWVEKIFKPAVDKEELQLGNPEEIFDLITSYGFKATVDLPAALYFEQLCVKYPNAKFILTTKDNSEVWFDSFNSMSKSIELGTNVGALFLHHVNQLAIYLRWMTAIVNKNEKILQVPVGTPLPNNEKEKAIASYEEHNRRVKEIIPSERLLEYKIEQGWTPLCEFLNIGNSECPTDPFPRSNSATSLRAQAVSATLFWVFSCIFVLYILFMKVLPSVVLKRRRPFSEQRHLNREKQKE